MPRYAVRIPGRASHTVRSLCAAAGIECRASGAWIERPIDVRRDRPFDFCAEPGGYGKVRITLPASDPVTAARDALCVLAYGLHDLVAKESIRGQTWSRVAPPLGRPKQRKSMPGKERQRRFRLRRAAST